VFRCGGRQVAPSLAACHGINVRPRCAAKVDNTADNKTDNTMPRTLFDKIWDFHRVGQRTDGRDLIYMDRHVLHELHAHHAFAQLGKRNQGVHRADLTFAAQDHTVATKPGRNEETNPAGAAFIRA
jgi:hypothetical protein